MQTIFWKGLSLSSFVQKTNQKFYSRLSSKVITFFWVFSKAAPQTVSTEEIWFRQKVDWKSKENQLEYMNQLSQKLNVKTMEDWYKVSREVNIFN